MKKYSIKVTEMFQRNIVVEAENITQAKIRARDAWTNTEFIIDQNDFKGAEFWVNGEVSSDEKPEVEKKV